MKFSYFKEEKGCYIKNQDHLCIKINNLNSNICIKNEFRIGRPKSPFQQQHLTR